MTWILLVAGLVLLGYVIHRAQSARPKREQFQIGEIQGDGRFAYAVVGESHYLDNLRAIVGTSGKVRHRCEALLFLDDRNQHDPNAVAVQISGKTVGYLPRAGAVQYRAKLAQAGHGRIAGKVAAVIVGGGEGRPNYGVWLDLPTTDGDG